jgi:hypothetical protein
MKKLLLAACIVSLFTGASFARDGGTKRTASAAQTQTYSSSSSNDTAGRFGLGFNSQLNGGLGSFALRYWSSASLGFEGIFGFALGDDSKIFDIGGKILIPVKKAQNLNLYGFGLLGLDSVTREIAGEDETDTGVIIGGGFGTEFFFNGIPDLAFLAEMGIGYNSNTKVFGTFGNWLSTVGLRYYF